ncbi:magnesium transporter [Actinopolyspora xinjiangensis]|uniref:Magnesium transporter n=1 Tax=Actinopolyspora xinjiangensis TaxID=405564 RepID=A0A1H0W7P8_9ACTN|nr:magnesium and cobalt transport protein CorA [Actinopolyspora xinjiangensis]SDP86658.1 magnesium transporter [Actinopolyspora xinjiangensis]
MVLADSAIYVDGRPRRRCGAIEETLRELRNTSDSGRTFGWIDLSRPDGSELERLGAEFELHQLALEDARLAHQRPKLDRYGGTLFMVLRSALYQEDTENVTLGEVHAFIGSDFVVTARQSGQPDLDAVRRRLEDQPELLKHGPPAVLYALVDRVVDDFQPVERELQNDLDEIETEVFGGEPTVSKRIYRLSREVIEFQRATRPITDVLDGLEEAFQQLRDGVELNRHLRDVRDHAADVVERVESHRQLLANILLVNSSLHSQRQNEQATRLTETSLRQNEDMKRISSWAAILFTPTLVGTVYGMNFTHMPELDWPLGYPLSLVLMLLVAVALYAAFRRRDWL